MTQKEVREQLELAKERLPMVTDPDTLEAANSFIAVREQLDEAMLKLGAWHEESCWCLEIFPGARSLCETGMQIKTYFGETR